METKNMPMPEGTSTNGWDFDLLVQEVLRLRKIEREQKRNADTPVSWEKGTDREIGRLRARVEKLEQRPAQVVPYYPWPDPIYPHMWPIITWTWPQQRWIYTSGGTI